MSTVPETGKGDEATMFLSIRALISNTTLPPGVMLATADADCDMSTAMFEVTELVTMLCIKVTTLAYHVGVLVDTDVTCVTGECHGTVATEDVVYVAGMHHKG